MLLPDVHDRPRDVLRGRGLTCISIWHNLQKKKKSHLFIVGGQFLILDKVELVCTSLLANWGRGTNF